MARRRQTGNVDDVLDPDRHAMERAARAAGHDLGLGRLRRGQRGVAIELDEDIEPGVEPLNALKQRLHQIDARKFPGYDRCRRL